MKKILLTAILGFSLVLSLMTPSIGYTADANIGVVQIPLVIKDSKAGVRARAALEEEIKTREKVLKSQDNQLKKLQKKFEKEKNKNKKLALQDKFAKTRKDLKRNWDDFNAELKQMDQRLTNLLRNDIRAVAQQVGSSKGLSVVLEYTPQIMYMDKTVDITKEVTARYDENFKKSGKKKKKK